MSSQFRKKIQVIVSVCCALLLAVGLVGTASAAKKKAKKPAKTAPAKPDAAAEPAKAAAPKVDVTAVFASKCKACHGADGKGKPPKTPDFTTAAWQAKVSDAQIKKAITEGVDRDEGGVPHKMKAFKDLPADQVDGLVAFVRGLKK